MRKRTGASSQFVGQAGLIYFFFFAFALLVGLAFGFAFLTDVQPHVLHMVSPFQISNTIHFAPSRRRPGDLILIV
jgi:hypothetical protein